MQQTPPASRPQLDREGRLAHLLTLDGLPRAVLERLLDRAQAFCDAQRGAVGDAAPHPRVDTLAGRTVATLFFEPSTRTRASFELAATRLGADVLTLDVKSSSTAKGETVLDTFLTFAALGVDAVVVRHAEAGIHATLAAHAGEVAVLNAGEAHVSHPTQGLLDALTIRQHKGPDLARLSVAIVGDVVHSRVASSAISALRTLGVGELRLVGPRELLPDDAGRRADLVLHDFDAGIAGCDVVMMLRVQKERMGDGPRTGPADDAAYHRAWGLTAARLARAKPDCIVMHPGPVNRGVELADEVMDGPRSVILQQVANGVAVRMAVLESLLGASR